MTLFKNLKELLQLPLSKTENTLCMVVSEQEGAEIWIAGRKTKFLTPKLVAVPKNRDVLVEIRQLGFEPNRTWVRGSHNLSFHYCDLKRIPLKLVTNEGNLTCSRP